jgi:transcriptional regulator with XRE-family HTH domain
MTDSSPTIRRRYLAAQLRKAREAAGLTIKEAAAHLVCTHSKISRIEHGIYLANVGDVRMLLDFYEVPVIEADRLLQIAREARLKGWWHEYRDITSGPFATYVGLEDAASAVLTYEAAVIPGLLQTPAYARAIMETGPEPLAPDQVEAMVRLRLARQAILTRMPPTELWAILDEAAIRRVVGSEEVMHDQLLHLAELAAEPTIGIQILPFSAGSHPAITGGFTILKYPEEGYDDSGYERNLAGDVYVEAADDLDRFNGIFRRLTAMALSQRESIDLAAKVAVKG